MQDNRPAVYLEGDTVIYRASALGHCLRSLWAARTGLEAKPFPKTIQKAMDEGTELEGTILNLLYEDYNFDFAYDSKQFQVELYLGAWNGKTLIVRGKVDEVGRIGSGPYRPVDVKAFSQSLVDDYRANGLMERYKWQQSVYDVGYGDHGFYMPVYNKDTGMIEPWTTVHLLAPYTHEQIRDRVLQVEEAAESGIMPDNCPAEFGCQYYYLHDSKPDDELIPPSVRGLVEARIALSEKIKRFESLRKTLDEQISGGLTEGTSYGHNGYTIVLYPNPNRFNTAAAKALLTEAEVDWQNNPDFWIPGKGTQVRMTEKKTSTEVGR